MTETSTIMASGRRPCPIAARRGVRRRASRVLVLLSAMLAAASLADRAARAETFGAAPIGDRGALAEAFRPSFDAAVPVPPDPGSPSPDVPARAVQAPPAVPRLTLPGPWPAIEVRTILVGLHLLGLCFGLGGATMLDFWLLRWMRWGYLPDNVVRTFEFVGKAVSAGLVMLWLSGCGFLALYAFSDPAKLANPKIVAKLVIVGALSINGLVIHRLVLPYVALARAAPLFDGFRRRRRLLFVLSGSVSGVSWYAAFALGLLREFNGRVPATTLLGIWLTLILLTVTATELLLLLAPALRPRAAVGDKATA